MKYKLWKIFNIVKCSRNFEFGKRTDQNFVTQMSLSRKGLSYFRRKKNLKQCQKEVIYGYILAFAGWWSIFWVMVGCHGCILVGGGWWWWMVVGGGGQWWLVALFSLNLLFNGCFRTPLLRLFCFLYRFTRNSQKFCLYGTPQKLNG